MNAYTIRQIEMFVRISQFGTQSGLTFGARATTLLANVNLAITTLQALGGDQYEGGGQFRAGAAERRARVRALIEELKALAQTSRGLDPELYPGVAESLRVPRSRSYQNIRNAVVAALAIVSPIKPAFVERAMPADFDVQLTALLADFDAATGRKYAGLQGQSTGTQTMKFIAKETMRDVKELKTIVTNQLRNTNPGLLATWKSVSRLQSAPTTSPEESTNPAPASTPVA